VRLARARPIPGRAAGQERSLPSSSSGLPAKRAFTLIELLVVIAIIAILSAVTLPMIPGANDQARIGTCESRLQQIGVALRLYAEDFNAYPASLEALYDGRYLARNPYVEAPAAAVNIAPAGKYTKLFRVSPNEPWRVTGNRPGSRTHPPLPIRRRTRCVRGPR